MPMYHAICDHFIFKVVTSGRIENPPYVQAEPQWLTCKRTYNTGILLLYRMELSDENWHDEVTIAQRTKCRMKWWKWQYSIWWTYDWFRRPSVSCQESYQLSCYCLMLFVTESFIKHEGRLGGWGSINNPIILWNDDN